jgi:transcriptional regulator, propionate catabolism operon regulatory protein
MLGKVLLIAPYKGLATLAARMARRRRDLDVTVRTADLAAAAPLLDWAHGKGFDLIISRGGTAELLEAGGTLPVVEIPVSGYDLFRLTSFIKDYSGRVSLIGFPNVCAGVATFSEYLNVEIPYTVVHCPDDVAEAIRRARDDGRMIIGDTVTVRLAEDAGLKGLLITSGPESVSLAFDIAANLLRGIQRTRERQEIVEYSLHALGRETVLLDGDGAQVPLLQSPPLAGSHARWRDLLVPVFAAHRTLPEGPYTLRNGVLSDAPDPQAVLAPLRSGRRFLLFHGADVVGDRATRLHLTHTPPTALGQLTADRHHLSHAAERARELLRAPGPLALVGEPGTGRTRMLRAIQTALHGPETALLLGIEIRHTSREALRQTLDALAATAGRLVAITGVEILKRVDQVQLARDLENYGQGVVLMFAAAPADLAAQGRLAPELVRLVQDRRIDLPAVGDDARIFEATALYHLMEANARHGKHLRGFSPAAIDALRRRRWPNNYADLAAFVDRLVHDSFDDARLIDEIPDPPSPDVSKQDKSDFTVDLTLPLHEIEARVIARVLEEERGNRSAAAARLGIGRSTIWRKLQGDA